MCLHSMSFNEGPDVNTVLMLRFLRAERNLGPRMGIHGILTTFCEVWSVLCRGLLRFSRYFCDVSLRTISLYPFSTKTCIKNSTSSFRWWPEQIRIALARNPLKTPMYILGSTLDEGLIWTFVIASVKAHCDAPSPL